MLQRGSDKLRHALLLITRQRCPHYLTRPVARGQPLCTEGPGPGMFLVISPSLSLVTARAVRCKFMLISLVWCNVCNVCNVSIAERTDLELGVTRPSPGERNLSEGVHQLREYKAIIIIFYSTNNKLSNTKLCLSDWFKVLRVDSRQNPCCKNPDKK